MIRLEQKIREKLKTQKILVMSHTVIGYPSVEKSADLVAALVESGVELIELQFPFSEPIADGPVLLTANHTAVDSGITVSECFAASKSIIAKNPDTMFLVMTYYNILFKRGISQFVKEAAETGVLGLIVPDLPPQDADELVDACKKYDVASIFLVTPNSSNSRLEKIASISSGMIYCVARKGVTGSQTLFTDSFKKYIDTVRDIVDVPIGVGFGVQTKEDVDNLKGKAEIAIVCSKAVDSYIRHGRQYVGDYMKNLRS